MRVMILDEETQEYLKFIFQTHVRNAIEPAELSIAASLWEKIQTIQILPPAPGTVGEPYIAEDGVPTIPIQGPLSVEMSEEEFNKIGGLDD